MSWHLEKAMEKLRNDLLNLGAEVENQLQEAVRSFVTKNDHLAQKVIGYDAHIDDLEVDLEEECLKCLALHQPVAIDLRFIVAVLKINNDLERIGDLAANIAKRTLSLEGLKNETEKSLIEIMADRAEHMLKKSLDCLVKKEIEPTRAVLSMDDEVDELNRQVYVNLMEKLEKQKQPPLGMMEYLSVSRALERIADLATNIAEDVLYLIEGNIVRHRARKDH